MSEVRWLLGAVVLIMVGCMVLQFNSQLTTLNPSTSLRTGSQLLYGSNRDGNWEIYTMDAVSKKERRLTNSKADDLWPVGSPDGKRIAFVSNRDGNQEIYVMDADGTRQTRLTMTQADEEDPVWSPDRKQIAFVSERDKNREIYVMNQDGKNQERLTTHPATEELPGWSPDGHHIAFVSYRDNNPEIYVMNADGTHKQRLTDHPANDGQDSHVWSPDGKQIAFVSERDGNQEIYVMAADGSGQRNLTQNPAADDAPVWSPILSGGPCAPPPSADAPMPPDPAQPLAKPEGCFGHRIAFISDRDGDFEIYVVHSSQQLITHDSNETGPFRFQSVALQKVAGTFSRLTHSPAADLWPVWSPDGSRIAFVSSRDGNPEIYMMQADGTDQRRMTHTKAEEKWVSWLK